MRQVCDASTVMGLEQPIPHLVLGALPGRYVGGRGVTWESQPHSGSFQAAIVGGWAEDDGGWNFLKEGAENLAGDGHAAKPLRKFLLVCQIFASFIAGPNIPTGNDELLFFHGLTKPEARLASATEHCCRT